MPAKREKTRSIDVFRPVQPVPCKVCPFRRTSLPGWLGEDSPEGFVKNVMAESPLPCHKTINYRHPDWMTKWIARRTGKLCAGAIIFAANCGKKPRPASLIPIGKADKTLVFATPTEFVGHHRSSGLGSWEEESKPAAINPTCFFCNKSVDAEYFCFGCKQLVCTACDTTDNTPIGPHNPEEHQ